LSPGFLGSPAADVRADPAQPMMSAPAAAEVKNERRSVDMLGLVDDSRS
jgi:hypothetical protein